MSAEQDMKKQFEEIKKEIQKKVITEISDLYDSTGIAVGKSLAVLKKEGSIMGELISDIMINNVGGIEELRGNTYHRLHDDKIFLQKVTDATILRSTAAKDMHVVNITGENIKDTKAIRTFFLGGEFKEEDEDELIIINPSQSITYKMSPELTAIGKRLQEHLYEIVEKEAKTKLAKLKIGSDK